MYIKRYNKVHKRKCLLSLELFSYAANIVTPAPEATGESYESEIKYIPCTHSAERYVEFALRSKLHRHYYSLQGLMFPHQMKLISHHPMGPTASFDLSLLHTHQLISLPVDSRLRVSGEKNGIVHLTTWLQLYSCTACLNMHMVGVRLFHHFATITQN